MLESILKLENEYPDVNFAPTFVVRENRLVDFISIFDSKKNREEHLEKIYDLNTIQERFNENEHLLSRCNKMIYTTFEYQDNSKSTLLYELKVNEAKRLLTYEVYLGNNKLWRIEEVIKWSGFTISEFATEIMMNEDEFIYFLEKKSMDDGGYKVAELICDRFTEINIGWLCYQEDDITYSYEEGEIDAKFQEMIRSTEEIKNDLYNVALYNPYTNIPRVTESNEHTTYTLIDDALYPYFIKGTTFLLEKNQPTTLSNGMYYIEMDNFKGIKFIHQKSNNEIILKVVLRSGDLVISKDKIKKLYCVCGVVKYGRNRGLYECCDII